MPDTVKSRFNNWFLFKAVGIALLMIVIIIIILTYSIKNNYEDFWWMITSAMLLIVFFAFWIVNYMITVVAAPNRLTLRYVLSGRKIFIDYASIIHVRNTQHAKFRHRREFDYDPEDVRLEIELDTGKIILIQAQAIANYDEVKEAIRRFRFGLD